MKTNSQKMREREGGGSRETEGKREKEALRKVINEKPMNSSIILNGEKLKDERQEEHG